MRAQSARRTMIISAMSCLSLSPKADGCSINHHLFSNGGDVVASSLLGKACRACIVDGCPDKASDREKHNY